MPFGARSGRCDGTLHFFARSVLLLISRQYLILDEAQNIKNFKSQRWQTLLNFNAKRRLLLTGTPLQVRRSSDLTGSGVPPRSL